MPRDFNYFRPTTLEDAVALLESKEEAKILAGGQSLLSLMKLRLMSPNNIVDISCIPNLSYINVTSDHGIAVGALTTHDRIDNSQLLRDRCYMLSEAASRIGDQQVRNRGTIGGSLCHADPAADLPVAILCLGAEITAYGPKGKRVIRADELFLDSFTTAIHDNEVMVEIRIPQQPRLFGAAYLKHNRRASDLAIVSVAALVSADTDGLCKHAAIALGNVAPKPLRALKAEKTLLGRLLDSKVIDDSSENSIEGISPPSDVHGSAEYRTEMVKVFCKRALEIVSSRLPKGGKEN